MDQASLEHNDAGRPSHSFRRWVVVALLTCHGLLAVTSVFEKSNTYDELIHLTTGYSYWTRNDYRYQPENGNLPQRWAALPLLFMDLDFPEPDEKMAQNTWMASHIFFFERGNDAGRMLFAGRVMIVCLSLLMGLLIFSWSEEIFGFHGALVSLTLFAFSPTLLAHGRLTTSDTASALFFLAAVRTLWALMHRVDRATILWAGAATAGLMLSKMSGALIVPMALIMGLVRLAQRPARPLRLGIKFHVDNHGKQAAVLLAASLAAAVVCWGAIWGYYGFRFSAAAGLPTENHLSFVKWEAQLAGSGAAEPVIRLCRDYRLLPEAYLYGLSFVLNMAKQRPTFMDGRYSETGGWRFFPFCFAVKTPIGGFALLLLAVAAIAGRKKQFFLYELWPLGILFAVYATVAVSSSINIGHRHILPLYPALFIFAGAGGRWFRHRRMLVRLVPILALGVFMAESLAIWPHYLAFFNAAAGGPRRGYRLLVESSLDWGQDLPGLKTWIDIRQRENARQQPVYLAYFGTASPAFYRLTARIIKVRNLTWMRQWRRFATTLGPGDYCISATELQQVYGFSGGWKPDYERAYTMARKMAEDLRTAGDDPQARQRLSDTWGSSEKIQYIAGQLRLLQFARLCAALKQREPDAYVGYSILIYHVSARELDRALNGPPESWGRLVSDRDG
ncbi:MAG: hypothetical protein ABIL58_12150 [Pseudomonadota bacterium]